MNPSIHDIVEFAGVLVAVVTLDAPADDRCRVVMEQGQVTLTAERAQWVAMEAAGQPGLSAGRSRRGRPEVQPNHDAQASMATTYLVPFTGDAVRHVHRALPVMMLLECGAADTRPTSMHVSTLDVARLRDHSFQAALSAVLQASGLAEVGEIVRAPIQIAPVEHLGAFRLEHAVYGSAGVVLDGWITNAASRTISIVSADLRCWATGSQIASRLPEGGAEAIGAAGHDSAPRGQRFTTVLPVEYQERDCAFYVVDSDPAQLQATFFGPVTAPATEDRSLALQLVEQAFGPLPWLPRPLIRQIYRPLLALPKRTARAKPYRFGPPAPEGGEPISSIIIPFYGDTFFLNCVFHLQGVLGPGFELILVVDDPRIWPELYAGLSNRSASIRVPTVLLQNADNYGFGPANNLGFMVASGDIVVLMNSDIMVLNPDSLRNAATAIRARVGAGAPDLIIGFSLLYEDDTIQHIGMEFPRSPLVGNLHLADHPMKGLPLALYQGEAVRRVPAVTGALMALSSRLYQDLGGFDPIYERGDFEDADLCLRARQRGAEIEVHVAPGLYHLERQSIPGMGDHDFRAMITHMNCVEFNARWDGHLSSAPVQGQEPPLRPRERKAISVRKRQAM
jgi:GT2 family glycosyltransferase